MSKQLASLLERINCKKVKDMGLMRFKKIEEAFDFVYERHQQQPVGHQGRKRMMSEMPSKKEEERAGFEDSINVTASREKGQKPMSKLEKFFSNTSEVSPSPATEFELKKFGTP